LWPRAILFDLDGTLIDSVPDIATSVNLLLVSEGLVPLTVHEVRSMIGHGIAKLVKRAFKARDIALEGARHVAMTERMMDIYKDHLTDQTVLLSGTEDILRHYQGTGCRVAIVTNKPEGFSREILDHFELSAMIDCVVGGDTGPERKPAPDMLLHALKQMKVPASDALMVGDSPADIDAARAAGIKSIAVHGGYTPVPASELGADITIKDLNELPDAIAQLKH
ncbi:MAG: phosphoglycolate phosphatase, partial [Roseibium sp.]